MSRQIRRAVNCDFEKRCADARRRSSPCLAQRLQVAIAIAQLAPFEGTLRSQGASLLPLFYSLHFDRLVCDSLLCLLKNDFGPMHRAKALLQRFLNEPCF